MATGAGRGVIYIDTSAAMKLVRPEEYSLDLSRWLAERLDVPVVSSQLIEVELLRATKRSEPSRVDRAREVLQGINVVAFSPPVIARAAGYADPELRSLDAIHLATAEHVASKANKPLEAFLAYDSRLLEAAQSMGMNVAAPGTP
jgi:predicted nucleic acid-binding protein